MYFKLTLLSFIFDRLFGEFKFIKTYKHPIIYLGDFIKFYEKKFYQDTKIASFGLVVSALLIVGTISFIILYFVSNIFIISLLGSTLISSKMLYESIKDIITNPKNIKYLVSRDTSNLSQSDINKACIESYGENLSDGVVAPLFYMLLFGLYGAVFYKAINTLDSMVGYKNTRYQNFGYASAKLDDILNLIPSKITAFLISFLMFSKKSFSNIFKYGNLHDSPNAGYPISAIAGVCSVKLGGDTSYFGKIVPKPYFGDGSNIITKEHISKALMVQKRLDIFIVLLLGFCIVL